MELRQLRYFRVVLEQEHLTRAAEILGIRATSLSQQIIALEREIGTALFRRTPRGMEPTAAGRALLPHAVRSLEAAEAGARAVRLAIHGDQVWRVGVTPGSPAGLVAVLRASVNADLHDLPVSRQLEALHSGDLDAGLVVLPVDGTGLRSMTVVDAPLGMLVSSGHPLAGRTDLAWADLDGQDLLWFARELAPGYHDATLEAFRTAGWRPRNVRAGPPRRGLFQAELHHGGPIVAIRPPWEAGDGLVWSALPGAPRLQLALVWNPSHCAAGPIGALAARLADEARPHAGEDLPRGRAAGIPG
ncbi:LysR family transcriptional regulator [Planomonospora sp. ID67723]|uniref:LysR family transcriptional regulator n=1 Tax=Planomonospora sp. ID67723 TaxID=2738134 RepID=UPI0018C41BF1|nr:LysR family transcriptional regulator [Planomonospora sp. ID67723]MBG0830423.1 LysR family transcriptional regulator [Planomonospora sp. ID67723]